VFSFGSKLFETNDDTVSGFHRKVGEINMRKYLAAAIASLAMAISAPATATPIVDVSNYCCKNGGEGIIDDDTFPFFKRQVAQTFAVVNSGVFVGADFLGGIQAPQYAGLLTAYLIPTTAGLPSSDLYTALGSVSLSVPLNGLQNVLQFVGFSVPVSTGEILALVLVPEHHIGATTAFDVSSSANDYAFGNSFVMIANDGNWQIAGPDLLFRTYVQCADVSACTPSLDPKDPINSISEPFTFSLFGTGLAGAVAIRRRKKVITNSGDTILNCDA
jgi:hypothetical protein